MNEFIEYNVGEDSLGRQRITKIRGKTLPEGILFAQLDVPNGSRNLTSRAIEVLDAVIAWGKESQRDASRE